MQLPTHTPAGRDTARATRPGRPYPPAPLLLLCLGLLAAAGLARGVDLPTLRPGLWESRVRQDPDTAVPGVTRMCLDASVQRELVQTSEGFAEKLCRRSDIRSEGGAFVTETDCEIAGTRIRSRSVTTLTGDTAYRTEVHATYTPPLAGRAQSRTVIESRYAGACLPGMKPGDLILPDGRQVSIGGRAAPAGK